jgi:hypothetical protein
MAQHMVVDLSCVLNKMDRPFSMFEFENEPYELLEREIMIIVGTTGVTTAVDFLGSRTLVFWYFRIWHIGNPDDKEWGVVKGKSQSREV